ncbi:hypothetical protein [Methanococcoides sp. NM1]|nr:hypothetical protein [Methanococcoides sp. NM1]
MPEIYAFFYTSHSDRNTAKHKKTDTSVLPIRRPFAMDLAKIASQ